MPLPESPPRRTSRGTIQRDYVLKIKDPEGEEGGYPPDDDEEAERQKRKHGGHAEGEHGRHRGDKGGRGRKSGGKTPNFNPGGKPGKLHRELNIPVGEKIGKSRLAEAAHSSNPEIRRDAIRAQTMGKWKK